MLKEHGTITLFAGPMRSSKSRKLIEAIRDHERARMKILAVKSPKDTRDGDKIVAREVVDGKPVIMIPPFNAYFVNSKRDVLRLARKTHCEVFAADEVEFFGRWFVDLVQELAFERKMIVLIAGLDLDAWRRPFGIMPQLLVHATYTPKVQASCFVCGRLAQFTQKLGGDPSKKEEPGDHYEARCFRCHVMPEDFVAESLGASIVKKASI